jgi:hypothetical protein
MRSTPPLPSSRLDVRRTIRVVYRHSNTTAPDAFLTSSTSFLTPFDDIEVNQGLKADPYPVHVTQLRFPQVSRSPLLTQEEEDYLVDQYTKSGFKKSLQFYQHKVIPFPTTLYDGIAEESFFPYRTGISLGR